METTTMDKLCEYCRDHGIDSDATTMEHTTVNLSGQIYRDTRVDKIAVCDSCADRLRQYEPDPIYVCEGCGRERNGYDSFEAPCDECDMCGYCCNGDHNEQNQA